MPRHDSRTPSASKIGVIGNLALFGLVLVALALFSVAWPALWAQLVREESMILGVVGNAFDLRQLLGISIAVTFVVAILRKSENEPRDLVQPIAGVLAGVAIAGGGWGASLGLAAIAVAALVRLAPERSTRDTSGDATGDAPAGEVD